MYKCRECEGEFEEPKIYHEKHEFWGMPCEETFEECPYCGSSDFDERSIVEVEQNEGK